MKDDETRVTAPSAKKNYILNLIYQIFVLIVPLITTPYISRVLLPTGVGIYSYTFSITNYFALFALLGYMTYGQREIAKQQSNKEAQTKLFWEIMVGKLFSTLFSISLFLIIYFIIGYGDYSYLMLFWIIYIAAQFFDISFFFQGNEKFGGLVIKNVIIKILGIALIFIFVKKSEDLWIYILCSSLTNLFGNLIMWFDLKNKVVKIKLSSIHPLQHLWPSIRLFIPTIAVTIYTVLDKTLIGLLIQDTYVENEIIIENGVETVVESVKKVSELENGYYEQADKIVKVALTIITSLNVVMISRNSNELALNNDEKVISNLYKAFRFVTFLGFPIMFGLVALAPNLVPWFLGEGFEKAILLIQVLSPLILIISIGNIFGIHYLIPSKKDMQYSVGIFIGAIINLILNFILIPKYWSLGAAVGSIVAEFLVALSMFLFVRKKMSIRILIKCMYKYVLSSLVMFGILFYIQTLLVSNLLNSIIIIALGVLIYFGLLLLLRDQFFLENVKNMLKNIKEKITKNKN